MEGPIFFFVFIASWILFAVLLFKRSKILAVGGGFVVGCLVFIGFANTWDVLVSRAPAKSVNAVDTELDHVQRAVLGHLKAPGTASFVGYRKYGSKKYYVEVDSQNGFGAMVRTGFAVVLPGGDPNKSGLQVFECSQYQADIMFGE